MPRDDVVHMAIADPANLHAIDELRLATRQPNEFGVALRGEIEEHLRKLARESEAFGLRAREDAPELVVEDDDAEDEADLEADDGISEAPLVRLVDSIIFQAAEDGASASPLRAAGGRARRALPRRRPAARGAAGSRSGS